MEKSVPSKPSLIPAFLALLVVIFFAYLLYSDLSPSRTEHTINPPIEIFDPPLTVIKDESEAPDNTVTEQEAELFVENLSPETNQTVIINENNDQFVRSDSLISLPNLEQRSTTIQELMADNNLADDTPIILNFTSEERSQITLAKLSNNIEDHTETITIITADGETISAPLADLLSRSNLDQNALITLILKKQHSVTTRFADIADIEISPSQSLIATINHSVQELFINDILPNGTQSNDLYYLHRVTGRDVQGLWGIIQAGLIDKFRQGLRLKGISRNKDLIQAVIPSDADEKLPSGLSSFLGKILATKVDNSYSYDLKTHGVNFDIDIVQPGQQLILIQFTPDELKEIYQFFSDKRNQGTETFAITD